MTKVDNQDLLRAHAEFGFRSNCGFYVFEELALRSLICESKFLRFYHFFKFLRFSHNHSKVKVIHTHLILKEKKVNFSQILSRSHIESLNIII